MVFKEWNAKEIKEFAYETIETFIAEYKLGPEWGKFFNSLVEWYIDFSETLPPLALSGPRIVAVLACAELTAEMCRSIKPQTLSVTIEFLRYLLSQLEKQLPEEYH
jgi:hypothetical protein